MASPSGCSSCWVNPPLSERRVTSERRCVMERTALYNTARVGEFCAGPRKNLILSSSDLPVRVRLRGLLLHQAEHDVVEPVGPPVLGAVRTDGAVSTSHPTEAVDNTARTAATPIMPHVTSTSDLAYLLPIDPAFIHRLESLLSRYRSGTSSSSSSSPPPGASPPDDASATLTLR